MSKTLQQVYVANPITSNATTDLMYFAQSPFGAGNDAGMTFANFKAQFTSTSVPSLTGTANEVLVNGTSGAPVTGTAITLTTPQAIGTSSSPQFSAVKTGAILDSNGVDVLQFQTAASAVNWIILGNSATGGGPIIQSVGSDPNINLTLTTTGTGQIVLDSDNLTTPIIINSGTAAQHITNLAFANTMANRTVTFPDANGTLLMTGQAINSVPSITFSSTSGIIGTTTNDNAAAGSVGEIISNSVASTTVTLSTNTAADVTSISLTAGDWDVWGNVIFDGNAATSVVYHIGWISTTSATLPANTIYATRTYGGAGLTIYTALADSFTVPYQRISIAAPTTVYLTVQSGFTINADKAGGAIYARRAR